MKKLKRAFAMLLTFVMCLSLLPTTAFAAETEESCVHSLEYVAETDADCVSAGCAEYYTCTLCGECFADAEGLTPTDPTGLVIPAYGHSPVTDPAVEATAEQPGLTEGSHCSVCNEVLVAQSTVEYKAPSEEQPGASEEDPKPPEDAPTLTLSFRNYKTLDEKGEAHYEQDCTAGVEAALCPETETNGVLSFKWQRYDATQEDETLRWQDIDIEDNDSAHSDTLVLIPTAEMLNVDDLLRCVVTATIDGQEPLTGYALFTLTYTDPISVEPEPAVQVASVDISGPDEQDYVISGETLQLTAAVLPEDAEDRSLTWSSSDETIATVDETGLVTGVAGGTVTITATAKDGSAVYGEMSVEVVEAVQVFASLLYAAPDDWDYVDHATDPAKVRITGYTGADADVVVPSTLDGKTVCAIDSLSSSTNTTITRVTIPASVTEIDSRAFENCFTLESIDVAGDNLDYASQVGVLFSKDMRNLMQYPTGRGGAYTIPAGVTHISDSAFLGANYLTGVALPASIAEIGNFAFNGCTALSSANIPAGVTSIGDSAFQSTSLRNVFIPASVETIGENAFQGAALDSISVADNNPNYFSQDGVLFNKDQTELICCPQRKEGVYTVPTGVTTISNYAFSNCSVLTGVVIPDEVVNIGSSSFESITDSLTIFGSSGSYANTYASSNSIAFSAEIPGTVPDTGFTFIISPDGSRATVTGITGPVPETLTIPNKLGGKPVTSIASLDHEGGVSGGPTLMVLPDSLTGIDTNCFDDFTLLTAMEINENNSYFSVQEGLLFSKDGKRLLFCPQAKTDAYTIPDGVTSIGSGAFFNSSLESIIIPNSVTRIGDHAFSGCASLTEVSIPVGVTSIGNYAFSDCATLGEVSIPMGVTSIGDNAFSDCVTLREVNIPFGVTSIGDFAFNGCANLAELTIPSGVASIGSNAFSGCATLSEVSIPVGVTFIGDNAFSGCISLTRVTIPAGVTAISAGVFDGCEKLESIDIPSGVTSIGNNAFSGCEDLSKVSIPVGVTSIGDDAFSGCSGLTKVTIPSTTINLGERAFSGCSGITEITIPSGVAAIPRGLFSDCTGLGSITIPSSVTYIANKSFANCTGLGRVTIPTSVTYISTEAFDNCSDSLTLYVVVGSAAYALARSAGLNYLEIPATSADDIMRTLDTEDIYELAQDLTLTANLVIPESGTLVIKDGVTLTVPKGKTLTVNGMLVLENGTVAVGAGGKLVNNGSVILCSDTLSDLTVQGNYTGGSTLSVLMNGKNHVTGVSSDMIDALFEYTDPTEIPEDLVASVYRYSTLIITGGITVSNELSIPYGFSDIIFWGTITVNDGGRLVLPACWTHFMNDVTVNSGGEIDAQGCYVLVSGDSDSTDPSQSNVNPATFTINDGGAVVMTQLDLGEYDIYGNPCNGTLIVSADGELTLNNPNILIHTEGSSLNDSSDKHAQINCMTSATETELQAVLNIAASHPDGRYEITLTDDITLTQDMVIAPNSSVYVSFGNLTVSSGVTLENRGYLAVNTGRTLTVAEEGTLRNGNSIALGAQDTEPLAGYLVLNGSYEKFDFDGDGNTDDVGIFIEAVGSTITGKNAASTKEGNLTYFVYSPQELRQAITQAKGQSCIIVTGNDITLDANLTVPANVDLYIVNGFYIPAGKTLTANGSVNVYGEIEGYYGYLEVNGTLTSNKWIILIGNATLYVSAKGTLTNNGYISLGSEDNGEYTNGFLYSEGKYKGNGEIYQQAYGCECYIGDQNSLQTFRKTVSTEDELRHAAEDCAAGSIDFLKQIYVTTDIVLNNEMTIPRNMELIIGDPENGTAASFTVSNACTLKIDGSMSFINGSMVKVANGASLDNTGSISLDYDWYTNTACSLTVEPCGTLGNSGYIWVDYSCTLEIASNGNYYNNDGQLSVGWSSNVYGISKYLQTYYVSYRPDYGNTFYLDNNGFDGYQDYRHVYLTLNGNAIATDGTLSIPGNFTVTVAAGKTLTVPAGQTIEILGTLETEYGGVIEVKAGGAIVNNGSITLDIGYGGSGKLIMNGNYSGSGIFIGNSGLSGSKAALLRANGAENSDNLSAALKSNSTVTLDNSYLGTGETFIYLGKSVVIPSGKTLVLDGCQLYLDAGVSLTVSSGAILELSSGSINIAGGSKIINNGTVFIPSVNDVDAMLSGSLSGSGVFKFDLVSSEIEIVNGFLPLLGTMKTDITVHVNILDSLQTALNWRLPRDLTVAVDQNIDAGEDVYIPENVTLILNQPLQVNDNNTLQNDGKIKAVGSGALKVRSLSGSGTVEIDPSLSADVVDIPGYAVTVDGPDSVLSKKAIKLIAALEPGNLTNTGINWRLADDADKQYVKMTFKDGVATVTALSVTAAHDVALEAYTTDNCADPCSFTVRVLPLAQSVAIMRGTNVTNQTLMLDIAGNVKVLRLGAEIQPSDALGEVTWSSSSPAIATVNPDGLVTAVKPGIATIKATTNDGSGKSASVKIQVVYYDAAAKLTAGADIPATGLESGFSAQMNVFGLDKATPMDASLFTYTTSKPDIATVNESGVISAGSKLGTATVTATLNNDPLKRKVTLNIKVVAPQADSVLLTPVLPNSMPYELQMLDADGNVTYSRSLVASYRLILDKYLLGIDKANYTFTISPTAYYTSMNGDVTSQSAPLTYNSNDPGVATVAAAKDGSATVTIKRTATTFGECVITGIAKDPGKVSNILSIQVRDYAPRLAASNLTLNTKMTDGVSTALLASYGNSIWDVDLFENGAVSSDFFVSYDGSNLLVLANGELPNGTTKAMLRVRCANNMYYYLPLTIAVKNAVPSISVKQSERFNLFYTDSEVELTVKATGYTVTDIALKPMENATFAGSYNSDGESITIGYAVDPAYKSGRPYSALTLQVYLEGYAEPIEKTFTLSTVTTKPSLVCAPSSSIINTVIGEPKTKFTIYDKTAKSVLNLDTAVTCEDADVIVETDLVADIVTLTWNRSTSGRATISVQNSNWSQPIKLTHSITVQTALPTAKLSSGTLKLSNIYTDISANTLLALNQSYLSVKDVSFASTAKDTALTEAEKLELSYTYGVITVGIKDGEAPKAATYSFNVTPWLEGPTLDDGDDVALKPVTLKVSVAATAPKVSLVSSTLKLNSQYPGEVATSGVKLNLAGYEVTGITVEKASNNKLTGEPISIDFKDGCITATLSEAVAKGTYSYVVTPKVKHSETAQEVELKPVNLGVTVYSSAAVSATVSASGKLDAVTRANSSITYTITRLNNITGTLESPVLMGVDGDKFNLSGLSYNAKGQPTVMLTLKPDEEYRTNLTYKIQLGFSVNGIPGLQVDSSVLSVKVTQSALKLSLSPKEKPVFQSATSAISFELKLSSPVGAKIDTVSVNTSTTLALRQAMGLGASPNLSVSADGDSDTVTLRVADTSRLKVGSSYTLVLDVTPEGMAENLKPTQIRATIKVYK